MNRFDVTSEFRREFKRFSKKYKTLEDDFKKFKNILSASPSGIGKNFTIIHSNSSTGIKIIKARMACRTLCDHSLRIIYCYFEQEQRIEFIELYAKGDKENEDRERIMAYKMEV